MLACALTITLIVSLMMVNGCGDTSCGVCLGHCYKRTNRTGRTFKMQSYAFFYPKTPQSKMCSRGYTMLQVSGMINLQRTPSASVLTVTSGIRLGCTDFPRSPSPPSNGDDVGPPVRGNSIELLEIDDANWAYTSNETLFGMPSIEGQNISNFVINGRNMSLSSGGRNL